MSSSFWAGYHQETPRRYRRGRDLIEFSPDGLHAVLCGPDGVRAVHGEGAALLREMLEEDKYVAGGPCDGGHPAGPDLAPAG